MPTPTEEPLTKVTLNLFTKDVEYMKEVYTYDYTVAIRNIVRHKVTELKEHFDGQ